MSDASTLQDAMQFDHVIQVMADGSIQKGVDGLSVPWLIDGKLEDHAWRFFSTGYSRESDYPGAVMAPDELIEGKLAEEIWSTPGIYVKVLAHCSPEEEDLDADDTPVPLRVEGWAVLRLK